MSGKHYQLHDVIAVLEAIAPSRYAEPWDNVGLLVGDPSQPVSKALLTIDYTPAVAQEAHQEQCDLVIAYHPPIFDAVKRITAGSVLYDAVRRGVAIYSPHTALDVADGGTNDVLAEVVGLENTKPLRIVTETKEVQYKLVVFVPEKHLAKVSHALFEAGAGHIGQYSCCSFQAPGTGTFFGTSGAQPAVGKPGRLEHVAEVRMETIVPLSHLDAVLDALTLAHPYETPAFDLVKLASPPERRGLGRVGTLSQPVVRSQLLARIKQALQLEHLLVGGPTEGIAMRVAVCAGAGGSLLHEVILQGVDVFLTGELRHHDVLRAAQAGVTVVCTLHSNSERKTLGRVQKLLCEQLAGFAVSLSLADRDPLRIT